MKIPVVAVLVVLCSHKILCQSDDQLEDIRNETNTEPTTISNSVVPTRMLCAYENATEINETQVASGRKGLAVSLRDNESTAKTVDDQGLATSSDPVTENPLQKNFNDCIITTVDDGDFYLLDSGMAFVPVYNIAYPITDFDIKNCTLWICAHYIQEGKKFSHTLSIITSVGLGISMVAIFLHMILFCVLDSLRNLPGCCLFSLCISLLLAYLSFLLPSIVPEEHPCKPIGMSAFYFFLCSFFWMNTLGFDVWRSLRMATSKLRLSTDRFQWKRFALYSVYGWGTPIAILVIAVIVDGVEDTPESYRLIFHDDVCWFQNKPALLIYFGMPLFFVLSLNLIFFVSSFVMINGASMKTSENRAALWTRFLIFMRLSVIMGLTWIFGCFATAFQSNPLWYIFVILNTLQGVLIFFSFSFSDKTRKECKKKLNLRKISAFPTQSSSQPSNTSTAV